MKTKLVTFTMIFLSTLAFAQEEASKDKREMKTLLGKDISHGGYLGFHMRMTEVNDQPALMLGGQAAWVIDHTVSIGVFGTGVASEVTYEDPFGNHYGMEMGYGGLLFEVAFLPAQAVHVGFPVALGVGGVGYFESRRFDENYIWKRGDGFFMAEPGVNIELSMTKHVRIYFGGSYRFVSGMALETKLHNELEGKAFVAGLKFGIF